MATRTLSMARSGDALRRWWPVLLLATSTVGSYGVAFYSFGVLIEPIHDDTGWSRGALSGAFSAGMLLSGAGGALTGRILDRFGLQPVFLGSLVLGSGLLLAASAAGSLPLFIAAWGIGAGVIGAGQFYNITMATTARLYYDVRPQAFSILTFIGGLASPIFFPLAGLLVDAFGWQAGLRLLVLAMIVLVLPAALFVRAGEGQRGSAAAVSDDAPGYASVGEAVRSPEVIRMVIVLMLATTAFGAIQVHHVPAMQAAGLSLAAASTIASVRGLLSLPGRAGLSVVVGRLGLRATLAGVYITTAAGVLALIAAGSIAFIWAFAVMTGLAFGMISPLHGLYATGVYGPRRLGTLLGTQDAVVGTIAASGPLILGVLVDATDSYDIALAVIPALIGSAALLLLTDPSGWQRG